MKYLPVTVRGLPSGTTVRQVEDHFNTIIHHETPCQVGPIAQELNGGTCSTTVILQKERGGQKRSCEKLRDVFHGRPFGGRQSTVSVSDTFRGLNVLSGQADAPIHIIFVHGLGGHAYKTWATDDQSRGIESCKAWPRDFLPKRLVKEHINARIYSLGYNANTVRKAAPNATITSAAEDLLMMLRSDSAYTPPREIYFVCHSLGGIVVAQALSMALFEDEENPHREEYRTLFMQDNKCLLKGVVLLGTPFRGSGQANIMTPVVKVVKGLNRFSATNDSFIRALREDSSSLDIPSIVQRFKSVINAKKVKLLIGCEEFPYVGDSLTTTYDSAISVFRDIVAPFRIQDSDHVSMVKFDDENDTEYKKLENLIILSIKPVAVYQGTSASITPNRELANSSQDRDETPTASLALDPSRLNLYFHISQQNSMLGPTRHSTVPVQQSEASSAPAHRGSDPTVQATPYMDPRQSVMHRAQTEPIRAAPNDGDPFSLLDVFDTAFIVDDTGSMVQAARNGHEDLDRWTVTKQALNHIARVAAQHDPDGIDIRFLKSIHLKGNNLSSADVRERLDRIDLWDGTHGGGTHFKAHLEELLEPRVLQYQIFKEDVAEYTGLLRKAIRTRSKRSPLPKKPMTPKPYNLIVITDGEAGDRGRVEEYIVSVASRLDEMQAPMRQIGIQFLQVGEDHDAKVWLRSLDNDLKRRTPSIRDIVDTTPFDSRLIQGNASFAGALELVLRHALLGGIEASEDEIEIENLLTELP